VLHWKKFCVMFILLAMILPSGANSQDQDAKKIKKYFKMNLQQLLNIVITTAGKKKEKIREIPASIVLVTREEIETQGYQTLAEVLENVPGLYLIDDYLTKNSGIRGFWSFTPNRNVIFLVNGIPYRDELTSSYFLENIPVPVEAIDRIEVVRGPMSVIYGNGAFFGIINIITNQGDLEASGGLAAVSVGTEKTGKLFARSSGKSGEFQYVFNGSYLQTDGLDVSLEKMGGPIFKGITTGGQMEKSEKFFNFSGTFKGFSFDASYTENQTEVLTLLPSVAGGTLSVMKDMRINVGYKKRFSDTFRLESKLYYFVNRISVDYDMLFDEFYGTQENGSSGFKAALNFYITPSPKLNITVGLDYLQVQDVFNNYTIPFFGLNLTHHHLAEGEAMVTRSIFTQFDFALSRRLKVVAGVMLEQTPAYTLEERIGNFSVGNATTTQATFSQTQVEFIPRLALIYSLNDRNIIKFLYGKAINRPSFIQNMDLLISPSLPPLEPETIQTLELNYIAQLSSKLTVNVSVFRNMLDNLIYRTLLFAGGPPAYYYANVGEMVTHGAEMTIIGSPSRKFNFEISGTYQDTGDRRPGFEDREVAYSPQFLGYFKAAYFFSPRVSLALSGNYVGSMETYFDNTLAPPRRLGEKVDGRFLVGANVRVRRLFGTGLFLNLRVSNLLDEEFFYPATANSFQFAANGTLARGRSFLLTLGWKF
jgi:outer membrane receptor protein involved in Fe transport